MPPRFTWAVSRQTTHSPRTLIRTCVVPPIITVFVFCRGTRRTICSKADLSQGVDADHYLTIPGETEGEVVGDPPETVLDAAIAAMDVEIELPFEE